MHGTMIFKIIIYCFILQWCRAITFFKVLKSDVRTCPLYYNVPRMNCHKIDVDYDALINNDVLDFELEMAKFKLIKNKTYQIKGLYLTDFIVRFCN